MSASEDLPQAMRALRVHQFGVPPIPEDVSLPQPSEDEVLVKMVASAINHHDLDVMSGEFPIRPSLPYVPGLEGSGYIVDAGEEVDKEMFGQGRPVRVYGGGLGLARPGTWAEYVVAPKQAVFPLPDGLDMAVGAGCGSVAVAAYAALLLVGSLQAGERVGVTGATGSVGYLVAQLALSHGASAIVGWVRSPDQPKRFADGVELISYDASPDPVDLLIDTVGGSLLNRRILDVKPGGRAVLVGYTAGKTACISLPELMVQDVSLLPLNMMRRRVPRKVMEEMMLQFADGSLHLPIDQVSWRDAAKVVTGIRRGVFSGRAVITW
ncbi:MAG: zinc-binding alcohol dehydrogenase family protein [Actinobacteria bacterium]|nr:zinc-binding alcohol dehydrogenase family protein [Actinomycetota bacterium]